jgi:mRNA-degrading endonuclease RelE of RelBE toxin-antitoxin system
MRIRFTATADSQLDRLPRRIQTRIIEKLEFYSAQPDPLKFAEPLAGSAEFRFRVGDYSVMFEILHGVLWVTAIKRRDEAYR